ncbi:MAG: hypothetical protein A2142_03260 [candidate division Zixibacteria bacterium RBG_16_48_11]|nr:MAG: hypothetical protein A2142_03260 [candidate division Zixibacteria bacterium RBG_16_48_11]
MYQNIAEPIEVLAVFNKKQIKPLSFKWRQRVYKIARVTQQWSSPAGKYKLYHFGIVDTSDNFFEICYSEEDFGWSILQTWT